MTGGIVKVQEYLFTKMEQAVTGRNLTGETRKIMEREKLLISKKPLNEFFKSAAI